MVQQPLQLQIEALKIFDSVFNTSGLNQSPNFLQESDAVKT